MRLPYEVDADDPHAPPLGLIVLQTDETIEPEFARYFADHPSPLYVSRVPSGLEVTTHTLSDMADELTRAASLLPGPRDYAVVGYGCTSGTAQIGADNIARLIRDGVATPEVTEPVSALQNACAALGVTRLGFLSPYVVEVSERLIATLADGWITCPVFGSFDEGNETTVSHIAAQSTYDAALTLAQKGGIDALFLSCTNLRTLDVIAKLETETGLPVLSSNQVLAWDLARRAEVTLPDNDFGQLFRVK